MEIDGAGWDEAISRLGTHRILMMSRRKRRDDSRLTARGKRRLEVNCASTDGGFSG